MRGWGSESPAVPTGALPLAAPVDSSRSSGVLLGMWSP